MQEAPVMLSSNQPDRMEVEMDESDLYSPRQNVHRRLIEEVDHFDNDSDDLGVSPLPDVDPESHRYCWAHFFFFFSNLFSVLIFPLFIYNSDYCRR